MQMKDCKRTFCRHAARSASPMSSPAEATGSVNLHRDFCRSGGREHMTQYMAGNNEDYATALCSGSGRRCRYSCSSSSIFLIS